MNTLQIQITGIFLILVPVVFNVFYALLQRTFDYPNILREPTKHVLARFQKGGSRLRMTWYGFMLSAVLFVPVVVLLAASELRTRNLPCEASSVPALAKAQQLRVVRQPSSGIAGLQISA